MPPAGTLTVAQNGAPRVCRCRPEEGGEVLRAEVRDGRVGHEEPAGAGRDRRAGRRERGDRGDDRGRRRAAEGRPEGQRRRGRGEEQEEGRRRVSPGSEGAGDGVRLAMRAKSNVTYGEFEFLELREYCDVLIVFRSTLSTTLASILAVSLDSFFLRKYPTAVVFSMVPLHIRRTRLDSSIRLSTPREPSDPGKVRGLSD